MTPTLEVEKKGKLAWEVRAKRAHTNRSFPLFCFAIIVINYDAADRAFRFRTRRRWSPVSKWSKLRPANSKEISWARQALGPDVIAACTAASITVMGSG